MCQRFQKIDLKEHVVLGWFHGIHVNSGLTTKVRGVDTCVFMSRNHFISIVVIFLFFSFALST